MKLLMFNVRVLQ